MREDIRERIELIKCGKVPEGYKKTKLGIIPKDWEIVQVKDVLEKVENPVKVKQDEEYTQIGIRSHGKGIFNKEPVTGKELGNKRVFWVEPDCFIVNIVFAWERAVARTSKDHIGLIASHRFPMYKSVNNKVDISFLVNYFMTSKGKNVLEQASPGGAGRNRTLGQERFLKSKIICPPITEQQEINFLMQKIDREISLTKELISYKELLYRGILKKEMMLVKKNKYKSFGDFFSTVSSKTHRVEVGAYLEKGSIPIIDQGKRRVAGYCNDESKRIVCSKNGMIVFGDHTRIVKFVVEDFVVGADGTQILISKEPEKVLTSYLYLLLRSLDLPNDGYGRHFKYLKEAHYYVPEIKKQKEIVSKMFIFEKEILLLKQTLELLKKKKQSLVQLLFNGVVRINEL